MEGLQWLSSPNNLQLQKVNFNPKLDNTNSISASALTQAVNSGALELATPPKTDNGLVGMSGVGFTLPDNYYTDMFNYGKVNYFIADGSQFDQTGNPYAVGTPVFEAPDYIINDKDFQNNVKPLIEREVEYDDNGNPQHIILNDKFKEYIGALEEQSKMKIQTRQELSQEYSFSEEASDSFFDAYRDFKSTGTLLLPNGKEVSANDMKSEFNSYDDNEKARIINRYQKLIDDSSIDAVARGRALAVITALQESKLDKGGVLGRIGHAFANAGAKLVESSFNVADVLTPDSIAYVSKYDTSSLSKKVDAVNTELSVIKGYDFAQKVGEAGGLIADIAISTVAGNKLAVPAKIMAANAATKTAKTVQGVADRLYITSMADEGYVLARAADALEDAAQTTDRIANWIDTNKYAKTMIQSQGQGVAFSAVEGGDFGQNVLKNSMLFAAGDLAIMGLAKGFKSWKDAAYAVTTQGTSASAIGKTITATVEESADALKIIGDEAKGTQTKFSAVNNVEGLGDKTAALASGQQSTKDLLESLYRGFAERFNAVTKEQAAELAMKGHLPNEATRILGKEMGKEYIEARKMLRDTVRKLGGDVDEIENYVFRGRMRAPKPKGSPRSGGAPLNTKMSATEERLIESGGEKLISEGAFEDVGIVNNILNYIRDNVGGAIDKITAVRLVQNGAIIRQAKMGSPAYRAAEANGGIVKLTRNVNGSEIDAGYAATQEWLTRNLYTKIELTDPALGRQLSFLRNNSKQYDAGFYMKGEHYRILKNRFEGRQFAAGDRVTNGGLAAAAEISRRIQDTILSGGVLFSPINSFAIAQLTGAMMADPLHFPQYAKAFVNAFSKKRTREFFVDHMFAKGPNEMSINTAALKGMNFVPNQTFAKATGQTSVVLDDAGGVLQQTYDSVKQAIPRYENLVVPNAERAVKDSQKELDKATEKLAQLETRTKEGTSRATTIERQREKVTKLGEKHAKLQEDLADARQELQSYRDRMAELDKQFNEGSVTYDIVGSLGDSKLGNAIKENASNLGKVWDAAVSDATFGRLVPMLQYLTTKSIVEKALKKGISEDEAYRIGKESLRKFWGVVDDGYVNRVTQMMMGDDFSRKQVLDDIVATFVLAPKYRGAIINRWFNTLRSVDPRELAKLENRLNVQWAMSGIALFTAFQVANKQLNGRYTWENPTGAVDELQIPMGNGEILRIPLFGTQASIIRALGRTLDAGVRGEGKEALNELISLGSTSAQPLVRNFMNEDWQGKPIADPEASALDQLVQRGKYLIAQYTGHPYLTSAEVADNGNFLKAILGAIEAPVRTSNIEGVARGEFYYEVIEDVEKLNERYTKLINRAYDDEELKASLQSEYLDKVRDRTEEWAKRHKKDISDLPQEYSSALIKAIIGPNDTLSLGGTETKEGADQIAVQSALKRTARQQAREKGLDLYTYRDYSRDLQDEVYGAPARAQYDFEQAVKEKQDGETISKMRSRYYDMMSPLYAQARGKKGKEAQAIYDKINALQQEYTIKVMNRLKPVVDKYGVNVLRNNNKILDVIADYIMVPGDYTPFQSKNKQPYLAADAEAFLRDFYGVGALSARNIPTDQKVIEGINKANRDLDAGRTSAGLYTLSQIEKDINAGRNYATYDDMQRIKQLITAANKR